MIAGNMIIELLDALRRENPQCELLALADISSGTVLCVRANREVRQEILDGYCRTATEMLDGASAKIFATAFGASEPKRIDTATIMVDGQNIIFQRSTNEPNEVMLCVCSPQIDVISFKSAVASSLDQIAAHS